jgi:hypothetical protein
MLFCFQSNIKLPRSKSRVRIQCPALKINKIGRPLRRPFYLGADRVRISEVLEANYKYQCTLGWWPND